ncbi:thiol reductant ABC exporter subunit CydD [Nocardioides ferulae]|uniref:thiol reductant ABC exporter subunit CydD n=1 Tax=Nocardioides ferulae TaxID=2340821 RepID=UPI000EB4EE4C|nr:thiol reductant ABC exporter subunit CydD [Nocardioides ferulae]
MKPTDPRLREQLAPAWRQLLGVGAAGVVGAVLVIVQAWVVTGLVVAVVEQRPFEDWAGLVLIVFAARAAVGWVGDVLAAQAAARVGTRMRRRIIAAILRNGAGGRSASTGELSVLATRGVTAAEPYLTRYLPALVLAGVLPLLTLAVIASQDLLSFVIVASTLPLVPVFGALVGLATRDRAEEQWRAMASLSGHFVDVVRGLPTLVAHRRAGHQSRTIRDITDRYRIATLRTLRIAFASSAVLELVATLSVALVAVVVGVRLADGGLDLQTALLVLLLAPEAYWPLRRVGAEFHAAAEGIATFEAVDALAVGGPDLAGPGGAARAAGGRPDVDAPLVVRDLTVTYPGRTSPAVEKVDALVLPRGVTVLTGPSGCGKSTLLAALADLLPHDGTVSVDGVEVAGDAWRRRIGWLPQRPVFVAGSIAANLRLAAPDASEQRLWSALRAVALEERVRGLDGGLEAPLGEDGASLSAGERARLALARVVLADRPWVFLDEPTAHLDELTERVIADTIVELGRTRGVLVVAHRPTIVDLADHVVELPGRGTPAVPAPAVHPTASTVTRRAVAAESVDTPGPARSTTSSRSLWGSTAVGALASASGVALTATAGWLIVQASTHPPVLTLMVAIVGVRTFGLARPVLRYAERLRSHDVALRMLADRRVEVYDAVVPLTPGRLGRRRGDVLASIVDDVDSVVDRELRVRMPVRQLAIVALLASLVAAMLLPAAAPVIGGGAALGGLAAFVLARIGAGRAERAAVETRGRLSAVVLETAQTAQELLMWQADASTTDRVATISDRMGAAAVRAAAWLATARALVLLVAGAGVALVAHVADPRVGDGTLSGPLMALLVLMPLALGDVITPAADAGALSARTSAAADRLHALEATAPAVRDTVTTTPPHGSLVEVDDVTGGWGLDEPALRGLSMQVRPGERVGVIGPSGCGKSTLAAMLLRFLDPAGGEVRLGGAPLDALSFDDVRGRVGLVDDDPHVFASTLVENVRFARPGASDAEVETALRQARLGGWLDTLPAGLHTWLGDGHAHVSGGERARIAVARSLLADQPVLVLDEPTAHLDHATATELAAELLARDAGSGPARSIVWITHSPVGLDLVDRVIDLAPPAASGVGHRTGRLRRS